MKAMVYHGANDIRFEEKPRPQIIDPTDAVVKIVKTTICGTDLGIWKGKKKPKSPTVVFSVMKASVL
ncbi:alcohol dehydrogenase catalytic domain-containing protein [Neisseria meningitidis]|nr:alcohol dehydrogenase catalytic domain-containing protein [Neisseria meningitidis]